MNDKTQLLLLGGGGHAAVVADAARDMEYAIVGFLDDDPDTATAAAQVGLHYLGVLADLKTVIESMVDGKIVHAAFGDNTLRGKWLDQALTLDGITSPPLIHRSAVISPSAVINEGVLIGPRAVINARAVIGRGAIINTGAIVEHDCVIGPFSHVAPNATLGGFVHIGEECLIGLAAGVLTGVHLEERVVLGAGAMATIDLPAGATAVGVPARALDQAEL